MCTFKSSLLSAQCFNACPLHAIAYNKGVIIMGGDVYDGLYQVSKNKNTFTQIFILVLGGGSYTES